MTLRTKRTTISGRDNHHKHVFLWEKVVDNGQILFAQCRCLTNATRVLAPPSKSMGNYVEHHEMAKV